MPRLDFLKERSYLCLGYLKDKWLLDNPRCKALAPGVIPTTQKRAVTMGTLKIESITDDASALTKAGDVRLTLPNGVQFHIILRGDDEVEIMKLSETVSSMIITPRSGNSIKLK